MLEHDNDTLDLTALPFWQWEFTEPNLLAEMDTGIPFDSIHRLREVPDTIYRKSLFHKHTLQVKHENLIARPDTAQPAWVFGVLLLLTSLACIYFHLRKIKFKALFNALVDLRAMDRLIRDRNLNRTTLMLPMGMLMTATMSLPLHHMAMAHTHWTGYLLFAVVASALYIVRNGLLRLLGNTFEKQQEMNQYITSNYLYHLLEATVIIALLYPFFYLPGGKTAMLYVIATFIAIAFLLRFFRSVKIFLTHSNGSSFYLFYYLCIVEIAPLLVVLKWFFAQ